MLDKYWIGKSTSDKTHYYYPTIDMLHRSISSIEGATLVQWSDSVMVLTITDEYEYPVDVIHFSIGGIFSYPDKSINIHASRVLRNSDSLCIAMPADSSGYTVLTNGDIWANMLELGLAYVQLVGSGTIDKRKV